MFTKMVVLLFLPVLHLTPQEARTVLMVQSFPRKVLLHFTNLKLQSLVSFFKSFTLLGKKWPCLQQTLTAASPGTGHCCSRSVSSLTEIEKLGLVPFFHHPRFLAATLSFCCHAACRAVIREGLEHPHADPGTEPTAHGFHHCTVFPTKFNLL